MEEKQKKYSCVDFPPVCRDPAGCAQLLPCGLASRINEMTKHTRILFCTRRLFYFIILRVREAFFSPNQMNACSLFGFYYCSPEDSNRGRSGASGPSSKVAGGSASTAAGVDVTPLGSSSGILPAAAADDLEDSLHSTLDSILEPIDSALMDAPTGVGHTRPTRLSVNRFR